MAPPLLALLLLFGAVRPAFAFDPARDAPAAAYGPRASPNNAVSIGQVAPSAVMPGGLLTVMACYTVVRGMPLGKLWLQLSNDRTGDWFYLYAEPGPATYTLTHYRPDRGAMPLARELTLGGLNVVNAPLFIGRSGDVAAFRLDTVELWGPGEGACPAADGLDPIALRVGLAWDRFTTGWPETRVTIQQAIESAPIALGDRTTVFYDGFAPVLGRRSQVGLSTQAPPSAGGQLDRGLAIGLRRMGVVVQAAEAAALIGFALVLLLPLALHWRGRIRAVGVAVWGSAPTAGTGAIGQLRAAFAADEPLHRVALAVVCLIGLGLRLAYLDQPIRGDEAYTFLQYASQPLWTAISKYNAPNNHPLHSAVVHVAYRLLGDDPWVLRLPAFAVGVLMVLASYVAGRRLYGRHAGLLAAALVASSSILIEYSTNARGYTMIALALLLLLALAPTLLDDGAPAAWAVAAGVASLGLFVVPTMIYGLLVVALWLAIAIARGGAAVGQRLALRASAATVALTAVLAGLLYTPIVLVNGFPALVANNFVRAQAWPDLQLNLSLMAVGIWNLWTRDLPEPILWPVVVGLVGAVVLLEPGRRLPAPLAPLLLLVMLAVSFGQRVALPPRAWLFFLPLLLLASTSMWAPLATRGLSRLGAPVGPGVALLALGLAAGLGIGVLRSGSVLASTETGVLRDAREIASFLGGYLGPRDRIFEMTPSGPELIYYFNKQGFSTANLYVAANTAPRAVVVVNTQWGQTLPDVLRFWSMQGSWVEQAQPLREYPSAVLYEAINPRP